MQGSTDHDRAPHTLLHEVLLQVVAAQHQA